MMLDNLREELAREEAAKELASLNSQENSKEVVSLDTDSEVVSEDIKKPEYSELELKAIDQGWDPEHTGDDFVSAKEYIRVGEIIEAKRKASKEAQELHKKLDEQNRTLQRIVEHNKAVEKATREATLRELEAERIKKIEEGDVVGVTALEAKRATIEAATTTQQESTSNFDIHPSDVPAVVKFKTDNRDWLVSSDPTDRLMQNYVAQKAQEFVRFNPNIDPETALSTIKQGLKETFPDKFKNPNKDKPALTGKSTVSSTVSKGDSSLSRLNTDMRLEFAAIQKVDRTYKLEEYIKQLELVGRLSK